MPTTEPTAQPPQHRVHRAARKPYRQLPASQQLRRPRRRTSTPQRGLRRFRPRRARMPPFHFPLGTTLLHHLRRPSMFHHHHADRRHRTSRPRLPRSRHRSSPRQGGYGRPGPSYKARGGPVRQRCQRSVPRPIYGREGFGGRPQLCFAGRLCACPASKPMAARRATNRRMRAGSRSNGRSPYVNC